MNDKVCTSLENFITLFEFCELKNTSNPEIEIVLCGTIQCPDEKACCNKHCLDTKCKKDFCSVEFEWVNQSKCCDYECDEDDQTPAAELLCNETTCTELQCEDEKCFNDN